MKQRPYSIYKHHIKHKANIWHHHRGYRDISSLTDALRDLTKRSSKSRIWRYAAFPTINVTSKVFEADEKLTETLKSLAR